MKPAPPLRLPDGTPSERLDRLFRTVVSAPKAAVEKAEARFKNRKKRAKKKPG